MQQQLMCEIGDLCTCTVKMLSVGFISMSTLTVDLSLPVLHIPEELQ